MMAAQLRLQTGYSEELEARTLELPLTGQRMSLFVIIPDYLDPGIQQLEANFTRDHIQALMSTLQVISKHNLASGLFIKTFLAGGCQCETSQVQDWGQLWPGAGAE